MPVLLSRSRHVYCGAADDFLVGRRSGATFICKATPAGSSRKAKKEIFGTGTYPVLYIMNSVQLNMIQQDLYTFKIVLYFPTVFWFFSNKILYLYTGLPEPPFLAGAGDGADFLVRLRLLLLLTGL